MNYDKTMYMQFSINKCNNYESSLLVHNCSNYTKCNLQTCKQIKEKPVIWV